MARYRYDWKNEANGWNYRLDIVPYDGTLDDSITTLDVGAVDEGGLGDFTLTFDELPFGLMDGPTFEVTFVWSLLPSALRTRLQNITSGNDRTIFLFFTDRGTNAATYYLEFCGTQANEESADFELRSSEDLAFEEYIVTYELIDCLHHLMSSTSGSVINGLVYPASLSGGVSAGNFDLYYEYYLSTTTSNYDIATVDRIRNFNVSSWSWMMTTLRFILSQGLHQNYSHTANLDDLTTSADQTLEWDTFINTGAVFYARGLGASAGAALDEDSAIFVTHVNSVDGELVGGLWNTNDEYSWSSASAIIDLMRDFCETFGVKASYYPEYVDDAGGDYIRYNWNIAAVGDTSDGSTAPSSVSLTKADSIGTISQGSTTVQKVETRWDLNSARYNYDITEYVAIGSRSRSTRSINFEPILHNVPSYKPKVEGTNKLKESGAYQTNRIGNFYGGKVIKAHEETKFWISQYDNIFYTTTFAEPRPPLSGMEDEDLLADNLAQNKKIVLWLNEAQSQSSPCAVAEGLLQAFSSQFQGTLEVVYPLSYSANVQPHRFAYVHSLSGGPVSTLNHLPWSRACVTSMKVNYIEGTNTITYVLMDLN